MKKKVFLRAFCNNNLGDDLFIRIITERYPNVKFQIVADKKKCLGIKDIPNLEVINTSFLYKFVNKITRIIIKKPILYTKYISDCDISVLIGGSMFIESEDWERKLNELKLIKDNSKKMCIVGSNFGPYKDLKFEESYRNFFASLDDVCFRDNYSFNLFSSLSNVRVAQDIVFSMSLINEKKIKCLTIIPISLEERPDLMNYKDCYFEKMINIIKEAYKRDYLVNIIAFCANQGDLEISKKLIGEVSEEIREKINLYNYDGNFKRILNIISQSENIVTCRFHGMILGWLANSNVYPLIYSNKTINVINDINYWGKYSYINEIDYLNVEDIFENNYELNIEKNCIEAKLQFKYLDSILRSSDDGKN